MKIEHFAINVENPAGLADWWSKNLGLNIIRADQAEPFIHFLADDGNNTLVEIYNHPLGELPDYPNMSIYTFHIAFAVDDIAGECDRLLTAGATSASDMITMGNGDKMRFVRDPWGVTIQFLQRATPLFG